MDLHELVFLFRYLTGFFLCLGIEVFRIDFLRLFFLLLLLLVIIEPGSLDFFDLLLLYLLRC